MSIATPTRRAPRIVARPLEQVVERVVAGSLRSIHGQRKSTPNTISGKSTPPQNGFGTSV